MSINKDFEDLLHYLNIADVQYLIVGAYAVIYYSEPRYTKDIDIWIKPDSENANSVYEALKKFGAPLKDISLADLMNPELVYQIGIEPNRIDLLMDIAGLTFDKAWKNKRTNHYGKEKIYLLDLNDLIKAKKASGRKQDQLDLEKLRLVAKKISKSRKTK